VSTPPHQATTAARRAHLVYLPPLPHSGASHESLRAVEGDAHAQRDEDQAGVMVKPLPRRSTVTVTVKSQAITIADVLPTSTGTATNCRRGTSAVLAVQDIDSSTAHKGRLRCKITPDSRPATDPVHLSLTQDQPNAT